MASTPPATLDNMSGNEQCSLPPGLDKLRIQDLNDLSQRPTLLGGIWESSEPGTKLYTSQKELAEQNLNKAQELQAQFSKNQKLREIVRRKQSMLDNKYIEWQQVEQEMVSALMPFTAAGVSSKLKNLIDENEETAKALKKSFDGTDLLSFIESYKAEQQQARIRRAKYASLT